MKGLDLGGIAGLIAALGTALAGIIVSASGLAGKLNTTRKRELRECEQGKDSLERQVLVLELWAFQLCRALAQHGYPPIPRPVLEPAPTRSE